MELFSEKIQYKELRKKTEKIAIKLLDTVSTYELRDKLSIPFTTYKRIRENISAVRFDKLIEVIDKIEIYNKNKEVKK